MAKKPREKEREKQKESQENGCNFSCPAFILPKMLSWFYSRIKFGSLGGLSYKNAPDFLHVMYDEQKERENLIKPSFML